MRRQQCRSRSPRPWAFAPSFAEREAALAEFGRLFWEPPDGPDVPPWTGRRAATLRRFREELTRQVELSIVSDDDSEEEGADRLLTGRLVAGWQRFTFFETLARMSDVLFRGPIEARHMDNIDSRCQRVWRTIQLSIVDGQEFVRYVADFRVSAVRVAMMLESSRPQGCDDYDQPDARTLASLLSLRCGKDGEEELWEMYRLLCQKLAGTSCTLCGGCFDYSSSAGVFHGVEALAFPAEVPKVLVPQCGHAFHTFCFASQLMPEPDRHAGPRGYCRCCGASYGWTSTDIDPMLNALALLHGPYVEKRSAEIAAGEGLTEGLVLILASICVAFAVELNGLMPPTAVWSLLTRRHLFSNPDMVEVIGEAVLQRLEPQEGEPCAPSCPVGVAVIGPEDRADSDDGASGRSEGERERDKHVVEVFLPAEGPPETYSRSASASPAGSGELDEDRGGLC